MKNSAKLWYILKFLIKRSIELIIFLMKILNKNIISIVIHVFNILEKAF